MVSAERYLKAIPEDRGIVFYDRYDFNSGVFFLRNNYTGKRIIWIWYLDNMLKIWKHRGTFLSDQMAMTSVLFDEINRQRGMEVTHGPRISITNNEGEPYVHPWEWRPIWIDIMKSTHQVYRPLASWEHRVGDFFYISD